MILLIDNYDSFVYNLARYVEELGCQTSVVRNDALSMAEIRQLNPKAVLLSPGPCTPRESGICPEIVRELGHSLPILGVCLGHQSLAFAMGASIVRANEPMHGRTSLVYHDGDPLFEDLPNPLVATRYHSLIVDELSVPPDLEVIARTSDGIVMAVRHCQWRLYGVQFHPESVLTGGGHVLLRNFLRIAGVECHLPDSRDYEPPIPPDDFFGRDVHSEYPHPVISSSPATPER